MREYGDPVSREPFSQEHDLGKTTARWVKLDSPIPGHEVAIDLRTDGAIIGDVVVDGLKILAGPEPETVTQPDAETWDKELGPNGEVLGPHKLGPNGWELVNQPVNDEGQQLQQQVFPSMEEKLKASVGTIKMTPVGIMKDRENPNEDVAGISQHGGGQRYRMHEITYSAGRVVEMRAEDPHQRLGHSMTVEQLDDGVKVTDEIVNLAEGPQGLSDGRHNYLATGEESPLENPLEGIKLLNPDGTEKVFRGRLEFTRAELAERGIQLDPAEGEEGGGRYIVGTLDKFVPYLLNDVTVTLEPEDFGGLLHVDIPDKGIITIEASAETADGQQEVALWLWHRKGTRTFCVEPVTGIYEGSGGEKEFANDRLSVAPSDSLKMVSSVRREQRLNRKSPKSQPQG